MSPSSPKYLREIELKLNNELKYIRKTSSEHYEHRQEYIDNVLEVHKEAFQSLIENTKTYSKILGSIKNAYDSAIHIRDKRLKQLITQEKVFGIDVAKKKRDDKIINLTKINEDLKEQNLKLNLEIIKLKKELGKIKDGNLSEYLSVMRERDARYTLYFENLALHMKVKELDGSAYHGDRTHGDPMVLRIALDKCREQLSKTQWELMKKTEEYADTVPQRKYDQLEAKHTELANTLHRVNSELDTLRETHTQLLCQKKSLEEEVCEVRERCSELERAGTPRPHWHLCGDFIGGGRNRWFQLTDGLTSRDILRVLLKELGPAAESEHLEYFDGLGLDPMIPPYLRYSGKVRNLRLSRRDVRLVVNDIWRGKQEHRDVAMQDYVTKYFEDRYQQASMRAEWAYNVCATAEQMMDEPQVRVWWGALHGQLSERVYWGLRDQWAALAHAAHAHARDRPTISCEDFEKVAKSTFPLKSEVDIKNLLDVVRKQLKMKLNCNEINLDKLFYESEEGLDRSEVWCELFRQRRAAQDRYLRELLAAVAPRRRPPALITVAALKRAFAIVDPAIDHIRMERYIGWVFGDQREVSEESALPLEAVSARLAAGNIERLGPRTRHTTRHYTHK